MFIVCSPPSHFKSLFSVGGRSEDVFVEFSQILDSKMRTLLSVMILYYLSQAAENKEMVQTKCSMEFDGQCIGKVIFFFANNLTDKGELHVFYKGQEHEEEIIAQCDWQAVKLNCHPLKAYTCELGLQKDVSVSIHKETNCVTAGYFRIEAMYQQPIDCNSADYKKGANDPTIPTNSTTTDKGKTTMQGNATAKDNRVQQMETLQSQTDTRIVAIHVAIGSSLLVVISLAAIFICRKKRNHRSDHPVEITSAKDQDETFLKKETSEEDKNMQDHVQWRCLKSLKLLRLFRETKSQEIPKV